MTAKEKIILPIINTSRRLFRNTWIHKIPLTSFIYKKLFSFTYEGIEEKTIVFRNHNFVVPMKDTAVVPSMMSGGYESYELDLYGKLLNSGDIILDIGANIGVYCTEAANRIGEAGKVYAFEPVQENIALLKKNIALNTLENVQVEQAAIGNKQGKIKIFKAKDSIATHSAGAISDNFENVNVTTIDHFVEKNRIKVDLIKMDIEGYEGAAIEGALRTLKTQQPILFIEFSSHHLQQCNYSPEKHAKNLMKLYKYCYLIDEKAKNLKLIKNQQKLAKLYNGNLILSSKAISH